MKIQVLTDKNSWVIENFVDFVKGRLKKFSKSIQVILNHKFLKKNHDINIILSYSKIIPKKYLNRSKFNLVVHESNLPKGKGMSPLSWQILQNKKAIIFTLFEANSKLDTGNIYYKKKVMVEKNLIFPEIKKIQINESMKLIIYFIRYLKKNSIPPKSKAPTGKTTYFKKRSQRNSELNINRTIKNQFNLMRINDNKNYPSFFYYLGSKYIIKLYKSNK
mgnify:CR=1 FL=1|tara:strand:+ start:65 stop:721 length:657 start_codon:yes stop_codon:yes gene_type:complete